MLTRLVADEAFAGEIILDIYDGLAEQFLKPLLVRFKCNAAVDEESEVLQYHMNVLNLVMIDHHLYAHLAPCRHTNDVADVPFFRVFDNLIQPLVPIAERRDASAGLVE